MTKLSQKVQNGVIESITKESNVRKRHYDAPLLLERERYIEYLIRRGSGREYVRITAAYMVRIVKLMSLKKLRMITRAEIEEAAALWSDPKCIYRVQDHPRRCASRSFIRVATGWFSFLSKLELPPGEWFEGMIQVFLSALNGQNLQPITINRYGWNIRIFFRFLSEGFDLRNISLSDVDAFIAAKVKLGGKPQAVVTHYHTLRRFFQFAGMQGWCDPSFHLGIKRPRLAVRPIEPKAPDWKEVVQLLKGFKGRSAVERRAKAMVILCAFYGLRSTEVTRLELEDIDWRNATLVVRRAKRGGVQQYPLLFKVGEAILEYLTNDRPKSASRLVFLSMRPPYGEVAKMSLWRAIGPSLRKIGTRGDYVGAHCLRHACATRLLQKGASLKEIADFLGHRDVRSVDVYARLDIRSLRKVAAFVISDLYETA